MGIEDIQISEELQTNAPSIKYSGNEGPKSPQQMQEMMMAQLEEEYLKYVDDMMEQGMEPMTLEQFLDQVMAEGQMSGGQPLPQDPTKPVNPFQPKPTGPVLPDRQMAAYGGIMGVDGRKKYGIGSWFQENIMDPIKENPLLAATAAYLGYDTYKNRDDFDESLLGKGIDQITKTRTRKDSKGEEQDYTIGGDVANLIGKNIVPIVGGLGAGLFTKGGGQDASTMGTPNDQTGIDLAEYKKAVNLLDQKQAMAANFNFAPTVASRKYSPAEMIEVYQNAANGGRIGFNMGGGADMGAPQMNRAQVTEEAITKIMQKMQDPNLTDEDRAFLQAKLQAFGMPNNQAMTSLMGNKEFMNSLIEQMLNQGSSQEDIIQRITEMNQGKPIMTEKNSFDITVPNIDPKFIKQMPEGFDIDPKFIKQMPEGFKTARAMGGRINRAEGGIMDLGGMEKDYRAEGGFVPIGKAEKADDVPARLSVNEFVFTADAVRNAGGGDIDQGAQVMENMMRHLEQGGQVSEESQGMAGARDMFATSQRLSEVI
jgi:hypothetical protein